MSYPSSERTVPFTPLRLATAAALLAVGPVLTRMRPSTNLSFGSPDEQASSEYWVGVGSYPGVVASSMSAFVVSGGQPTPFAQCAFTRWVFPGSYLCGTTWNLLPACAVPVRQSPVKKAHPATKTRNFLTTFPLCVVSCEW